jgi:coenzyme Q-binding protein COQ10
LPSHSEIKELPYSAEQLHELVSDIESYPDFLPWCVAARILERDELNGMILADLVIGFKALRETFTSRVYSEKPSQIKVTYEKGPFKYLNNSWKFIDIPNGCSLDFEIDFEFRSPILGAVMEPLFYQAVRRMVRAFEERARELYS